MSFAAAGNNSRSSVFQDDVPGIFADLTRVQEFRGLGFRGS